MKFQHLVTTGFLLGTASYSLGNEAECRSDNGFKQRDVQELVYSDIQDLKSDYCEALEIAQNDPSSVSLCLRYARLVKNIIRKEYRDSNEIDCGRSKTPATSEIPTSDSEQRKDLELIKESRVESESDQNIASDPKTKNQKATEVVPKNVSIDNVSPNTIDEKVQIIEGSASTSNEVVSKNNQTKSNPRNTKDESSDLFDQAVDRYAKNSASGNQLSAIRSGIEAINVGENFFGADNERLALLTLEIAQKMNKFRGNLKFADLSVNYSTKALDGLKKLFSYQSPKLTPAFVNLITSLNRRWDIRSIEAGYLRSDLNECLNMKRCRKQQQAASKYKMFRDSANKILDEIAKIEINRTSIPDLAEVYRLASVHTYDESLREKHKSEALGLYENSFGASDPRTLILTLKFIEIEDNLVVKNLKNHISRRSTEYEDVLSLTEDTSDFFQAKFLTYKSMLRFWLRVSDRSVSRNVTKKELKEIDDAFLKTLFYGRKVFSDIAYRKYEWINAIPPQTTNFSSIYFDVTKVGKARNISIEYNDQKLDAKTRKAYEKRITAALEKARFIPSLKTGIPVTENNVQI